MKRSCLVLSLCLFFIMPVTGLALDKEDVTLNGSFVWARDDGDRTGDLKAVFTPGEEHDWSVAFHFIWEDEDHVYLGTANGNLESGALSGTAQSDSEDRQISFRFEGEFQNGTFNGSHGWINKDGSLERGGTLTLAK